MGRDESGALGTNRAKIGTNPRHAGQRKAVVQRDPGTDRRCACFRPGAASGWSGRRQRHHPCWQQQPDVPLARRHIDGRLHADDTSRLGACGRGDNRSDEKEGRICRLALRTESVSRRSLSPTSPARAAGRGGGSVSGPPGTPTRTSRRSARSCLSSTKSPPRPARSASRRPTRPCRQSPPPSPPPAAETCRS